MIDLPLACPRCGAAVYDEDYETHDEWHKKWETMMRKLKRLGVDK